MAATTPQTYNTDQAKWEAYQFSDPFASNSFLCYNKKLKKACRPNCDFIPKASSKEDVEFINDVNTCLSLGYKFCEHCDASDPATQLDLPLVKRTIESINYSIGFTNDNNEIKRRAYSVPSVPNRKLSDGSGERQLTRNESEHIKLVELACRHIAAAASSSYNKQDGELGKGSKKRRRGGVLGFKELASKSKLSPWHFHRVFKSITGLTPKSYGDHCWKFIKERERPPLLTRRSHFKPSSQIASNFQASPSSKRRQDNGVGAPRAATPTNSSPSEQLEVSPFSRAQESSLPQVASTNALQQSFIESDKNSLDINMNIQPFRHHSLDLGSMLDFSEINSTILNNFSPQLISTLDQLPPSLQNSGQSSLSSVVSSISQPSSLSLQDTNNYVPSLVSQPVQMPYQLAQSQPQTLDNFYTYAPNEAEQTLLQPAATDVDSTSTQIDESQWPNLQASTPEQLSSKLLTPPSSISDNSDFNIKTSFVNEVVFERNNKDLANGEEPSFYDVLKNSPWDVEEELDLHQNFGLINNDGSEAMNMNNVY